MATRNPMNQRYTDGGPAGQTRKSAASAKPKRKAADTVYISNSKQKSSKPTPKLSKEEQKIKREQERAHSNAIYSVATILMNNDPRYKKFKLVWWAMLGLAVLILICTWIIQVKLKLHEQKTVSYLSIGLLLAAYAPIIIAIVLDFAKVRPIRKAARVKAASMSKKQLDAILEEEVRKNQKKKLEKELKKKAKSAGQGDESASTADKDASAQDIGQDAGCDTAQEAQQGEQDAEQDDKLKTDKQPEEKKRDMSRINSYRRGSHK